MYLDLYLQPLKSLDESFDAVFVLIKSGKKLITHISFIILLKDFGFLHDVLVSLYESSASL